MAQPTVAPTDAPRSRGEGRISTATTSRTLSKSGYRWRDVNGNLGKYRSDVNFGNGLRLLGSNLSVYSTEGHGKYFDELVLNTQGLGNDPYQFSSFRVQKNRLYRYDFLWRENAYYNPALPIAGGQHFMDTSRRLQDHQIVLLPQSSFRIFAGYSRNQSNRVRRCPLSTFSTSNEATSSRYLRMSDGYRTSTGSAQRCNSRA